MIYSAEQYYGYYPYEYQPQFWQALVGGVIDIVIMVALGVKFKHG